MKTRAAALPAWCARVPAGTTIAQIEVYNRGKLTAAERRQARACLASKRA